MMDKFYTGVGSRKTPVAILDLMRRVAVNLSHQGYILRSGGAIGADRAFETGADFTRKQIFLAHDATAAAMEIAARFHPAWHRCSDYAKQLHGRNAFQVLGFSLDSPSKFLICWTPDGCISHETRTIQTGGTGTAISIAFFYHVPVFNLARPEHLSRLEALVR